MMLRHAEGERPEREPRPDHPEHPVFHPGHEPDKRVPEGAKEQARHVGELAGARAVLEAMHGGGERYALDYIDEQHAAGKSDEQITEEMELLRDSAEAASHEATIDLKPLDKGKK